MLGECNFLDKLALPPGRIIREGSDKPQVLPVKALATNEQTVGKRKYRFITGVARNASGTFALNVLSQS